MHRDGAALPGGSAALPGLGGRLGSGLSRARAVHGHEGKQQKTFGDFKALSFQAKLTSWQRVSGAAAGNPQPGRCERLWRLPVFACPAQVGQNSA